eukprot:2842771-Pyramimonas_sp.AAC.1
MRSIGSNYVDFEYLCISWLAAHAGTMAKQYHITGRSNIRCRPHAIPSASADPALGSCRTLTGERGPGADVLVRDVGQLGPETHGALRPPRGP